MYVLVTYEAERLPACIPAAGDASAVYEAAVHHDPELLCCKQCCEQAHHMLVVKAVASAAACQELTYKEDVDEQCHKHCWWQHPECQAVGVLTPQHG